MKKSIQYSLLTAFLVFSTFINLNAQPHPGEQSGTGTVNGGRIGNSPAGAPIGSGTFMLIGLAAAYSVRKVQMLRAAAEEE